jgi:ferredoxin
LQKRCPAGKCKALIKYIVRDGCIGCTLCAQACPTQAIPLKPYEVHTILDDKCVRCGACMQACKFAAVVKE